MKSIKVLSFVAVAIAAAGCTSPTPVKNTLAESQLYGSWNCKVYLVEEDIRVDMDYDVTYFRNGMSNGFGTLKIKVPDLPEMEYSVTDSSGWEFQNEYLVETTKEIKLVNISHPGFDDLLNLEQMFPQNISESSEVLILNDSILKVKSETDGSVYSCNKLPNRASIKQG